MKTALIFAIALMMSGCGAAKQGGQGPTYTKIIVEPEVLHLSIGSEALLTATVYDQNGNVIPQPVGIQWQPSGDPGQNNCVAWVTTPTPGNDATATIQTTSAITDCEFDLVVWVPAGNQTPKQIYTLANIEVE